MDRSLMTVVMAACLLATTAIAQPQIGSRLGSGLSKANFLSAASQRFTTIDADGDGIISEDEFLTSRLAAFDKADKNSDGVVSRGEARGLNGSNSEAGRNRADYETAVVRRYEEIADGGDVTEDSYLAFAEKVFTAADQDGDEVLKRGEARGLTTF